MNFQVGGFDMKRIISLLLVVVAMVCMLTACSKFECAMCEKEVSGKKHEAIKLGEKVEVCDKCYEAYEKTINMSK
jgi:hypothetical protein